MHAELKKFPRSGWGIPGKAERTSQRLRRFELDDGKPLAAQGGQFADDMSIKSSTV